MVESIQDEMMLNQVMEDVAFYIAENDITDSLDNAQLNKLDKAIKEADTKNTITWDDFKKEMNEWKKSNHLQTFL